MARDTANLTRRGLLGSTLLLGLLGTGCGYLLYPERRGRRGGAIDGVPFIVDLLWLLPGLIPGIICLVVDFSSGCIYVGGDRVQADPRGPVGPVEVAVEVQGKQVAKGVVEPDGRADLIWSAQVDPETLRLHGRLIATNHLDDVATAHLGELI